MYKFENDEVKLVFSRYVHNNNLALKLELPDGTLYAVLSKNLESIVLPDDYAYLDVNNIPNVEEFITQNGIGVFVNAYCESGFCRYPLYKICVNECLEEGAAIIE